LSPHDHGTDNWSGVENREWEISRMEVYAAMIDRMDRGIGKIVEELEQSGELENTLILFLADNGGCAEWISPKSLQELESSNSIHRLDKLRNGSLVHRGNIPDVMPGPEQSYQSYGKAWANVSNTPLRYYTHYIHEGGISTPLIAHWPNGIEAKNELSNHTGHVKDIMATCLDVAGVEYPHTFNGKMITPLEGRSLKPAFENKATKEEPLFWEHHGNRGIRLGEWKLVALKTSDWELYNLNEDRTELNNLATRLPDKAKELEVIYDEWAERCGVLPWPVNKIEPQP